MTNPEPARAMQIWVDADACPGVIKEFLYRTADRRKIVVTLVANQPMRIPESEFVRSLCVPGGMNMADRQIAEMVQPGDLVITADIPLAAAVIEKGAEGINPRGEHYNASNIGERLASRNLIDQLRGGSLVTGGPAPFNDKDRQNFANQLDRQLAKRK